MKLTRSTEITNLSYTSQTQRKTLEEKKQKRWCLDIVPVSACDKMNNNTVYVRVVAWENASHFIL